MSSSSSTSSNPNPWSPYETYKDCSQGICSIYCPQWCYIIFPPPPPSSSFDDGDSSIADFSPLVIAVIGILASAFILVTYYTLVSRYCKRRPDDLAVELDPASLPRDSAGLDEALIKTIAVRKYSKADGSVEGTDCSVCLSEFKEDESLRLLPKCNHAFHLPCIDAWLKTQATCPLCRSHIMPLPLSRRTNDTVLEVRDLERVSVREEDGDVTVERGTEHSRDRALRRSVSLDSVSRRETPVRISDILEASDDDEDEDARGENLESGEDNSKSGNGGSRHMNVVAMKRSSSTGRFMFSRYGKNRSSSSNTIHPSVDLQI